MPHTITSRGIFHGLPIFGDDEGKAMNIIVTGANGISGTAMVKMLSETPDRWAKIYALSRRPPTGNMPSRVEHIAVDFLDSTPEQIAQILKSRDVQAYVPTCSLSPLNT
jgi:nucleoside-diphosphate-sugar epimerase